MSATTKTSDNATMRRRATDCLTEHMRRRATDWKKPLSVIKPDVFGWHEGDGPAILEDKALSRVSAALSGAKAISAILMQLAIDRTEEDSDHPLRLCESVEHGLLDALASCIEAANIHATGGGSIWTTRARGEDEQQAVSQAVQSIAAARCRKEAGRAA